MIQHYGLKKGPETRKCHDKYKYYVQTKYNNKFMLKFVVNEK